MSKSFEAQLDDFAKLTERKLLAIMRQSIQDVVEDSQTPKAKGGRMPVDTGALRSSLVSELNGGGWSSPSETSYSVTIAQMDVGDVARFGYTMGYAEAQEFGGRGRTGNHFVGAAAAKWQDFVKVNAARARNMS